MDPIGRVIGAEGLFSMSMVTTVFTILAMVAGVLCYLYGPYWGVRKVPGPPTIPLLGHLPLMAKYGPDVFSVLAKQYGPIFRSVSGFFSFSLQASSTSLISSYRRCRSYIAMVAIDASVVKSTSFFLFCFCLFNPKKERK